MLSLMLLAFLPLLASSLCDGYWDIDSTDNACKFRCDNDGSYVTKAELTFDEIRDECSDVLDGYRFNDCNDKDDLVWSTATDRCECPYCGCPTENTAGTPKSWTELINKQCKNCTCTTHPYDTGYSGNIYQCDTIAYVYDPYNWDDFRCPSNWNQYETCTDTVSGEIYHPGKAYFADVDANEHCEKFCYCKPDGTSECQTSFANIVNLGSDKLKAAFWDRCEYYVQSCTTAPDRMFTQDTGPSCHSWDCPKCSCGSHNEGDIWWEEYESQDEGFGTYVGATTCARCECQRDGNGVLYADCDDDDNYPNSVATARGYTCPGGSVIKCHEENEWADWTGSSVSTPDSKTVSSTKNSVVYKSNQPQSWCANSVRIEIESDDTDDIDYDWGSDSSPFCAIYGTNERCYWYDYSVNWSDCYGDSRTESTTTFEYCCNTDDCNHIDISMNKNDCTENTRMSTLLQTLWECIYTGNGRSGFFGEDCNHLEEEIVSCTSIKNLYEDQANCFCKAYKNLYDDADADWKLWIKDQIDMFMTSFTEWNDVLNCPGRIVCDLEEDSPEVTFIGQGKANDKFYFVSVLFTFVVGLIMPLY